MIFKQLIRLSRPKSVLNSIRFQGTIKVDDITRFSPYEEIEAEVNRDSSIEDPILINAYGNERDIACVCGDVHFMRLVKGPPVQSKCGHWFMLVNEPKFWESKDS